MAGIIITQENGSNHEDMTKHGSSNHEKKNIIQQRFYQAPCPTTSHAVKPLKAPLRSKCGYKFCTSVFKQRTGIRTLLNRTPFSKA